MNESEAARLVDYGQSEVAAKVGGTVVRGIAMSVRLAPTMTIQLVDGASVDVPLTDCHAVRS